MATAGKGGADHQSERSGGGESGDQRSSTGNGALRVSRKVDATILAEQQHRKREERESEEMGLRFLFNMVDRDGGGTIELEELVELLTRMGSQDVGVAEVASWLSENDTDSDGVIDFEEFSKAMRSNARCKYTRRDMMHAWAAFDDLNPTGKVQPGKIVQAVCEYGPVKNRLSRAEAEQLIALVPRNGAGEIDYRKLINEWGAS